MAQAQALSGVRVVELCQMVAGPYCAKLLADMGAEVVKVEEPGRGDPARGRGSPPVGGLFLYLNTNKLSLTLNLKHPWGQEAFRRLVKEADLLVEDTPPSTLDSLGLGFESLEKLNPRLILTSITPFGQEGPYKSYRAYSLNCFSAGGEAYLLSKGKEFAQRPPIRAGGYFGDYEGGGGAALATLAALYWQRLSGQGQRIDFSRQEWSMGLNRWYMVRYPNDGEVESRNPNAYPWGGNLPCKDGYICLVGPRDYEWTRLVEAMGNPPWASQERFKDNYSRAQHGPELNQLITSWLMQYTKEEVYRRLQGAGVAVGPVNTVEDIVNSPQFQARRLLAEMEHPQAGRVRLPTAPFRLSYTPWQLRRRPPLLGEHNQEVLSRLGYSPQEIAQLQRQGAV